MAKPISYNFISANHAQVFVQGELVGWINGHPDKACWIFHPLPEESFKGVASVDLEELKEMVERGLFGLKHEMPLPEAYNLSMIFAYALYHNNIILLTVVRAFARCNAFLFVPLCEPKANK